MPFRLKIVSEANVFLLKSLSNAETVGYGVLRGGREKDIRWNHFYVDQSQITVIFSSAHIQKSQLSHLSAAVFLLKSCFDSFV